MVRQFTSVRGSLVKLEIEMRDLSTFDLKMLSEEIKEELKERRKKRF
jgi:hypothetical protein